MKKSDRESLMKKTDRESCTKQGKGKMQPAYRASLTVLCSMILPLMFSLLFSMLEVTRICGLDTNSQELANQMAENTFSEFQPLLWEEYSILALDMGYAGGYDGESGATDHIEERMLHFGNWYDAAGEEGRSAFLSLFPMACELDSYGVLTDQGGIPLILQGAEAVKMETVSGFLQQWLSAAQDMEDSEDNPLDIADLIRRGKDALEQAKEEAQNPPIKEIPDSPDDEGNEVADNQNLSQPGQQQSGQQQPGQTQSQQPGSQQSGSQSEGAQMKDNPFTLFDEWNEKGLLSLLTDPQTSISDGSIEGCDTVSARIRQQETGAERTSRPKLGTEAAADSKSGTEHMTDSKPSAEAVADLQRDKRADVDSQQVGMLQKVLFGQYLLNYFSDFLDESTDKPTDMNTDTQGLRYQTEYVIQGQNTDRKNLESIAGKLLLLRELQNLASIFSDQVKVQQAAQAATALAAVTANPVIIQAVQLAIICVWAFAESILDVRLLLDGGKVPIIKNSQQWTSDLFSLGECVSANAKAKESETGMTYRDYLRAFLAVAKIPDLGLRSCDVMELHIRRQEEYQNVRMDHMIYRMKAECSFQAQPLFFRFVWPGMHAPPSYSFTKQTTISYL